MAMDKQPDGFTVDIEKDRKGMPEFALFGSLVDFARENYRLATSDRTRDRKSVV